MRAAAEAKYETKSQIYLKSKAKAGDSYRGVNMRYNTSNGFSFWFNTPIWV